MGITMQFLDMDNIHTLFFSQNKHPVQFVS